MYRKAAPLLFLAAFALAPAAFAQDADASAAPLPAWDQLTPAQRDLLIAPVRDRWNREPDKRPQFIEFAKRWQSMPPAQRERARHGMQRWEGMNHGFFFWVGMVDAAGVAMDEACNWLKTVFAHR